MRSFSTSHNVKAYYSIYSLDLLVNKKYPTKKRDVCDFCKNYSVICGIDITPKKVQSTICYQEEQWLCKEEVLFSRGFS